MIAASIVGFFILGLLVGVAATLAILTIRSVQVPEEADVEVPVIVDSPFDGIMTANLIMMDIERARHDMREAANAYWNGTLQ